MKGGNINMTLKYYLAYGSNLNLADMAKRCPDAVLYGLSSLDNYELVFRGKTGKAYLNIETKVGAELPVAIWQVSARDELQLDLYEDYPDLYSKQNFTLPVQLVTSGEIQMLEVFAYIMSGRQEINLPSEQYYSTCLRGYADLGFDPAILKKAYAKAQACKRA